MHSAQLIADDSIRSSFCPFFSNFSTKSNIVSSLSKHIVLHISRSKKKKTQRSGNLIKNSYPLQKKQNSWFNVSAIVFFNTLQKVHYPWFIRFKSDISSSRKHCCRYLGKTWLNFWLPRSLPKNCVSSRKRPRWVPFEYTK